MLCPNPLFELQMIDYMLKYIDDHYGKRPSFNEGERAELEYLRKAVPALKKEALGDANMSPGESTFDSEKRGLGYGFSLLPYTSAPVSSSKSPPQHSRRLKSY